MEMLAGLMEVINVRDVVAYMNPGWGYRLWLIKWFPMFFDILTILFLVAGCMLLWLNIRLRNQDVIITQKATSDLYPEREFSAQEQPDLPAGYGASYLDAFPSEERINTDAAQ